MIACPKCGAESDVMETRGARRRRVCSVIACSTKFSTVEVVSSDDGETVSVPRSAVRMLVAAVGK